MPAGWLFPTLRKLSDTTSSIALRLSESSAYVPLILAEKGSLLSHVYRLATL